MPFKFALLLTFLLFPALPVRADEEAPPQGSVRFESVAGSVAVQALGGMTRVVQKGDEAYSGETITVAEKSQSRIMLSDGSTLDLFASTHMALAQLKQSNGVKNFFFKMGLGKVYATVTKLMNSNSTFEIEAGGVVCGVRGTEFAVDYNPATNKVGLNVVQGVVAASAGGQSQNYTAGQHVTFFNGHRQGNPPGTGLTSKTTGKTTGGTNTGNGPSHSQGGNNSGGSSSPGSNGNESSNGNGGSQNGAGAGSSVTNGTSETGTGTTNPSPSSPAPSLETNTAVGDLNSQFTTGILVNSDNNLNSAQQTLTLHLVVPGREVGP